MTTESAVVPTSSAVATTTPSAAATPSAAVVAALPPINAANIHVPANLTLSSSCFLLDAGCSRYATGDGAPYAGGGYAVSVHRRA